MKSLPLEQTAIQRRSFVPPMSKIGVNLFGVSNSLLIVAIVVLTSYLVYQIFFLKEEPVFFDRVDLLKGKKDSVVLVANPAEGSWEKYDDILKEHNVFQPIWERTAVAGEVMATQAPPLGDIIKVTGIVLDRAPQVIVEDLMEHQVVFLTKGDSIHQAVLIDIKEDQAVFNYYGQKVVLTP